MKKIIILVLTISCLKAPATLAGALAGAAFDISINAAGHAISISDIISPSSSLPHENKQKNQKSNNKTGSQEGCE